jgi:hypothetical protein
LYSSLRSFASGEQGDAARMLGTFGPPVTVAEHA